MTVGASATMAISGRLQPHAWPSGVVSTRVVALGPPGEEPPSARGEVALARGCWRCLLKRQVGSGPIWTLRMSLAGAALMCPKMLWSMTTLSRWLRSGKVR